MRKFLRVGVILLFFVVALVQPNEACRVLIEGKEEARANNKPSILVFQTLQKGTEPSPGNPIGYTPGNPRPPADTTNTRAFKGKEEARANDKKSVLVLQTLPKGTVPPPGNPTGYTPGSPRPLTETTNTRAFKGKEEAWANDKPSIPVFQTLQKGTEPSPGNPIGYTPGSPRPPADTTNTRAFKGKEEVRANDKKSVLVLQTLPKGTVPPPGNPAGYTPGSPRPLTETINTRAFKGKEEAWANDKTSVLVLQTLPKGMVPRPGNPTGYTLGSPRPFTETTNTRAFKGKEEAWANDKTSVLVLQTLQKGTVPPPGNPTGYTPGSPRPLVETTNTRAFKGKEEAWANDKTSVLVLQTLEKGPVPPPRNPQGYTPGTPKPFSDTNTRAFAGCAMATPHVVNPVAFLSHGITADLI
ncbi:uncharacterized protein LOC130138933 [Syzygium oleosum]|uniref:uncharacterized protein LOC130138933 n=1 Tax=Syzygium oleosum TaxID=219896 RepID=UPI0024B983C2|nr:uncharacterized protein LOC130138933 [Syzygium oleosum]